MNRFKLKPVAIVLIAVCAIGAVAIAMFYSKSGTTNKSTAMPAATARPALTVTTTQAQTSALPIQLTANGNIAAWQEASIGAESNGLRLAEVQVNVGDVVQRGQLLARFADDSVQADVAQDRAAVNEATASALEATANADRVRTLAGTGTFSGQQINQYLTAEQTAKARVESAKAGLAAQALRLKNTQVLAPDSGIISARSATVGAVLASGTELFRLIRQGRLEWRAEVTSTELGRLLPGTVVSVTAASGARLLGRVRMVAPTVDPQTRSGLVYVDLPTDPKTGSPSGFKAGMFGRGEFELGSSNALTVPQQSVVVRDGFSYVFRLNADQHVSQIKLQMGRRVGDRVEVLSGLNADAVLVASGAGFLNDGDLVKVVPAPASTANAPVAPVKPSAPASK
ncbi:MAG TPA: efflux transporter periplasmic adaptor subunit [Polaromonas sp.]|uniref:efflux RND transporter periplasmic adaptor subunit n=1 Tax=Polaromonas sp. UBA4122 TaxID=1947074 RepID=UPI000EE2BFCD|nr:efflux transporter periplasmic adaptor subunit [Polaromonas sp.]